MAHKPLMSNKEIERRKIWQEKTYQNLKSITQQRTVTVSGRKLIVLPGMFAPLWEDSSLLAQAVKKETKRGDRVLDLGTGTGIQGIVAASMASTVLSVDINPRAIKCAKQNIVDNNLADKIKVKKSDLFSSVSDKFDLIIFNPPFRWFKPRDILERGELDENYKTLKSFFKQVKKYLTPGGRILLVFSESGDLKFIEMLIMQSKFKCDVIAKKQSKLSGWHYLVYRLSLNRK